ncbi:MAG: transcription antitermination factor NusB [Lachnospiraceae bacterium]|nr:transcription antitermination factor NusB [Lachnospiraceae bacterium]
MKRSEQREAIFKLLFMALFNEEEEMPEKMKFYLDTMEDGSEEEKELIPSAEESAYIREKYQKIQEKLPEIDEILNANSRGWKTGRMSKVDLTILRLAVFEVKFDDRIPTGVAINEAVEIAKRFGGDESASFINGILGKVARDTEA